MSVSRNEPSKPIAQQKTDSAEEKRAKYRANIFYVDPFDLDMQGHPKKWKVYFAKAMVVWAVLSQIFLLLQLIKIFSEKDAAGVSLSAYIVYVFGNIVWFTYGAFVLAYRNMPIILSSVIAFILASIIIVGIILYG